jgi:DNA-binding transcriptional ArsR family regulator
MKCKDALARDFVEALPPRADEAATFLKSLANPHRLLILCALAQGERNVSALIAETGVAPTSMSQHLSKLKDEGVVDFRRDHRTLTYFISHPAAVEIMAVLYAHFCAKE